MDKLKILIASLVIIVFFGVAMPSFANGRFITLPPCPKSCFDGGYIGVGSGVVYALSDVVNSYYWYNKNRPEFNIYRTYNFKLGEYGFNANVFAGYGKEFFSPYYFGMEAFANYFSTKTKGSSEYLQKDSSFDVYMSTEVKNSYAFGGDARLGRLISPRTMLYILFGIDYANFDGKGEAAVDLGSYAGKHSISNEFDKWKMGYMPGIGIETCLNNHISLRVQYTYTFYSSFKYHTSFVKGEEGWQVVSLDTKVSPHRDMLTLMLAFK